jgi:hypothetical protein
MYVGGSPEYIPEGQICDPYVQETKVDPRSIRFPTTQKADRPRSLVIQRGLSRKNPG